MKIVAIVPVKGNSERIKNKNTRLMDGKPLFLHTVEKLISSDLFDSVYVDTESVLVERMAMYTGCDFLHRDSQFASNKTDGNLLLFQAAEKVQADIYVQLLATSPFISVSTIEKGINTICSNESYDSAVLMRKEKYYQWKNEKPAYDVKNIPNSEDLDYFVYETMGLYIIKKESLFKTRRRIGEKPLPLYAEAIEAIDVNYEDDFELAEFIAAGKRQREQNRFNVLKNYLSSTILSDVFYDLDISTKQIINGYILNDNRKKVFGRAVTLRIRKLEQEEDFRGIYEALKSYSYIGTNQIITVENELPEYAYFGDLNARIAITNGATGALIGGVTRDTERVLDLDFPVISKGYKSTDVRGRATLDFINEPITIEGVLIKPGDLIFGDCDGVVVIPKNLEKKILDTALTKSKNENAIIDDILSEKTVFEIMEKRGEF